MRASGFTSFPQTFHGVLNNKAAEVQLPVGAPVRVTDGKDQGMYGLAVLIEAQDPKLFPSRCVNLNRVDLKPDDLKEIRECLMPKPARIVATAGKSG